jgi:hypothetical protein
MKKMKYLAAVLVLCASSTVSYYMGFKAQSDKHYEAACHMSDLIRCYEDHLTKDSLIEDYGCFEELEGIFLHDDAIGNPVNLGDYSWCY